MKGESLEKAEKEKARKEVGAEPAGDSRAFTTYGLKTTGGELVYFAIQPTNISVLSHANIEIKIRHLLMVLTALPHLEVACLDSAQRFDDNQQFMESRIRQEDNPKVRHALEQDREFLDSIQLEMSTARQFVLALRFKNEKTAKYSPESTTREKPCMTRASKRGAWAHRRSNGCWPCTSKPL